MCSTRFSIARSLNRRHVATTCAFALVCAIDAATPYAAASQVEGFIIEHECKVVAVLNRIHEQGSRDSPLDRFAVLSLREQSDSYVQCMFIERDSKMFCEAASGAFAPLGEQPRVLSGEARASLERLGFRQEEATKNFERIVDFGTPVQVTVAARLMLETLVAAYGARVGMALKIAAPLGQGAEQTCGVPVS